MVGMQYLAIASALLLEHHKAEVRDDDKRCESWCASNEKPWSTKCFWDLDMAAPYNGKACQACSQCEGVTEAPTPAPTPPPTPGPTVDTVGYWFNRTFAKLDNVSAMMDGLEKTQFRETLAISTLEGDLGAAGIKIGDYEVEAVPFEKSVYVLRQNLTVWRNSSYDAERQFNTDEATVASLENRTKAIMKSPEEMAAARAANAALEESRTRLATGAEPLLERAHSDSTAFEKFEELALNKTEEAAGAMNVRGAIDRAREAMRVVAAKSYADGIPEELRPDKLVAQFE